MVRLAHLSDIHLAAPIQDWRLEDWFNKRFPAWVNYHWLGRRHRFRQSDEVMAALLQDLRERSIEHIIFSGDASALGFESEIRRAAEILQVKGGTWSGLAVPGNHDYCTATAATSGHFEHYFRPWQVGRRPDEEIYPFAQRVGSAWVVGVNSATANFWPWDAAGSVGLHQRERLGKLLDQLEEGPRILVTHYPVCLANGQPEHHHHGLRDLAQMVELATQGSICLWLHGHRHTPYLLPHTDLAPFPVICAGSATQTPLWSYFEYLLDDWQLQATRRYYDPGQKHFVAGESCRLLLGTSH